MEFETVEGAWRWANRKVLSEGGWIMDGEEKLKEVLDLSLTIKRPSGDGEGEELDEMRRTFLEKKPVRGWGYSYGQRIFDFRGVNQFSETALKLRTNPDSKSATVALLDPPNDSRHVPCACLLDFKMRDGKLHLFVFFRSQEVFRKGRADAAVLSELLGMMAEEVGAEAGKLYLKIASAHIYERDIEEAARSVSV